MESTADLALEAGKNATEDASGKDILTRYRQLVAQKSASKASALSEKIPTHECNTSSLSDDTEGDRVVIQDLGSDLDAEMDGSDKENVDPMPTAADICAGKTPSRDTVARILGSVGGSLGLTGLASDGEAYQVMAFAAGKNIAIPKQALEDQWAMLGEHDGDSQEAEGTDSDESRNEGVRQDPGELLSTGILEASFLDSSAGQMSLGLSWKADHGVLSPVNEHMDSAECIKDLVLSKSVATFSPQEASTNNIGAAPSSVCFVEWKDASNDNEASADVSALRDTSVMISESSGAVTDDGDDSMEGGSEFSDQHQVEPSSEPKEPQTPNDRGVEPLSPLSSLRKNAMDQALEESEVYMNEIRELTAAKRAAEAKAKSEAKRRRDCEKQIDELLNFGRMHGNENGAKNGSPCTGIAGGADADELNKSTLISPLSKGPSLEESEDPDTLATSLMERNKTLVKEVRFADQTCVELAERNSALQKEVEQLSESVTALRIENGSLHEGLVKSSQHGAKMDESRSHLAAQMSDQKERYEEQLNDLTTKLSESEDNVSVLRKKVAESDKTNSLLGAQLAAAIARADTLQERVDDTNTGHAKGDALELFRLRKEMDEVVTDRDSLRLRCSDLEAQLDVMGQDITPVHVTTPLKAQGECDPSTRTPTSTVLAKTLQSELQRGHSVNERVIEAEKSLVEAKTKLESLQDQLKASQAETSAAQEEMKLVQERLRTALDENGALTLDAQELVSSLGVSQEAVVDKTVNAKEVVNLRTQLHRVLFENKSLLTDVSSYKTCIEELETTVKESHQQCASYQKQCQYAVDQLERLREKGYATDIEKFKDMATASVKDIIESCRTVQDEANRRLRRQQQQIAVLSDTIVHLQSQLDFETTVCDESATLSFAGASLTNCVEAESPERVLYGIEFEEDNRNVMNATFASDRATRSVCASASFSIVEGNSMDLLEEAIMLEPQQEQNQLRETSSSVDRAMLRDELRVKECIQSAESEKHRLSEMLEAAKTELQAWKESMTIQKDTHSQEKTDLLNRITELEGELQACEQSRAQAMEVLNRISELEGELLACEQGRRQASEVAESLKVELDANRESLSIRKDVHSQEKSDLLNRISELEGELLACQQGRRQAPEVAESLKAELDANRESLSIQKDVHLQEKSDLLNRISELEGELQACEQGRMQASEVAACLQESKSEDNQRLLTDIESLRSKLDACNSQYQNSQSELENFRNEAADMLNDLECKKYALEDENKVLREEVKDQRSRLKEEENKSVRFHAAAKSAETELRKASGEVLLTRASMSKLQTENRRLMSAVEEGDMHLRSCQTDLKNATEKVAALEEERSKLARDFEHTTAELSTQTRQSEDHVATIGQYKSLRLQDAQVVRDLRTMLRQTNAQTNELKLSFVTCNDKLARAMEQNMNNDGIIEELRNTESMLLTNLSKAEMERDNLQGTVTQREEELQRARDELSVVQSNTQRLLSEKELTIRELKQANEQNLLSSLSERDSLMKESEQAIDCVHREITSATAVMRNTASKLGVQDDAMQRALEAVQERTHKPTNGLLILRPHAQDQSRSIVRDAHDGLTQLRALLMAVDDKITEHNSLLFDLDLEKQRLTSEVTTRFRTEEELKVELVEARNRERNVEGKLKASAKEIESYVAKLGVTEATLQKSSQSIATMESKLTSSLEDCKRLKHERDLALAKVQEKETSNALIRQVKEGAARAENELKKKAEQLNMMTTKHASLERKCEKLREYVRSLTDKCEEWSESYHLLSSDLVTTKKAHEELLDKVSQMRSLVEDCCESSCSECRYLRSAISAKCEVREALLTQRHDISWQILKPSS